MNLLKQLNDQLLEQQLQEQFDQQTIQDDIAKIVDFYKDSDIDINQLRDVIGDELEQLEYDPEQVEQLLPQILAQLTR